MDFNNMKNDLTSPEDVTSSFSQSDIDGNKIFAVLASVPFLFWLPLVACANSDYGKFYANQGLILTILTVACAIAGWILGIVPLLGWLLGKILWLVSAAGFIFLLVSAIQGKARKLPIIGDLFVAFN